MVPCTAFVDLMACEASLDWGFNVTTFHWNARFPNNQISLFLKAFNSSDPLSQRLRIHNGYCPQRVPCSHGLLLEVGEFWSHP
jgi:hypothetical protein